MKVGYDVTKGIGLVTPSFFRSMTGGTHWTQAGRARAWREEVAKGKVASKKAWSGDTTKIIIRKDCKIG